ncbi:MAG: glycosyl transferase [Gammaproteobacteria bacterium]|nr:glycosyl transferase [Gammaproteobacteria bacterium]
MTKKILLVRFSSIGDIVLTTPVMRAIKTQYNDGDVELHYLTKSVFTPVLGANPYLDRLFTLERNVAEVADVLRRQQYDYIIDLHNNLRSWQVKRALSRPTYTLDKLDLRRLLYIRCKINLLPNKHIVERYLDVARPLGIVNDGCGLDYFLRPQDEINLQSLPVTHRHGYVAIVIGGKHAGKLYPVQQLVQVCRQLQEPVVLLGGREDQQRGDSIVAQVGARVFNACGRYSLNQSAALVRDARYVISNDTGLMHIATAFKKRIISLWGATVPEFGMYPYLPGEGSQILEAQSPQRPYSKHGDKALFRSPYACWTGLEPEKIILAAQGGIR